MSGMNRHKVFWALWVGAFLAYELPAVFNAAQEDTFSEFFWGLFRINDSLPLWQSIPIHGAIVAFGVWLIGHLAFGLWGGPKGRLFDKLLKDGWVLQILSRIDSTMPPDFNNHKGQATPEQAAEYERRIGRGPEQVDLYMTEDPDGPLADEERCSQCGNPFTDRACGPTHAMIAAEKSSSPICPGCSRLLQPGETNWVHSNDSSPICARDRNDYMTQMKGHRWRDTEGPHSVCEGCKMLFAQWGGGVCPRALPGTDFRL